MLDDLDRGRRQLRDLVAGRRTRAQPLLLAEAMPAPAAPRPMVDHPSDLTLCKQRPPVTGMTGLATLPAPRSRLSPALRRLWRILARRRRRIPRVAIQPLLEILDTSDQLRDLSVLRVDPRRQRQQNRDDRLAPLLRDRLRLGPLHTARFAAPAADPSGLQQGKPCYFVEPAPIPPPPTTQQATGD